MNTIHVKQRNSKNQFFQAILSCKNDPCAQFLDNDNPCIYWLDNEYNTPLHLAALKGNYYLCKLFLTHGASKNALNGPAKTPYDLIPDTFTLFEDEPLYVGSLSALKELLKIDTKNIKQLSKQGSLSSDEQDSQEL